MKTKYVIVENYKPEWKNEFEFIKNELLVVLVEKINSIEHVRQALETIGYIYEGDLGISGREAFKYENKPYLMAHHLYVCNSDNEELHRHITFRDYLRHHKEDRDKYSKIKKEMALKYPEDIDSYIEGKQPVILEIYKKCGLCN